MTSHQLLRAVGGADDRWIEDAGTFFTEKTVLYRSRKKLWTSLLTAAVLIVLMGVTAYASDVFGLRAAQDDSPQYHGDPVVNLTGYRDSAVYKASQEWTEWKNNAYLHGINLLEPGADTDNVYVRHGAFCDEAIEKLNEITGKYDLTLPDQKAVFAGIGGLYDIMGQSGFLPMAGSTGGYPRNGILWDDGSITNLLDAVRVNGKNVYIELYRTVKGSFLNAGIRSDPDLMEEWSYSATDGTELILDIGPYQSAIIADLPSSFLFIVVKSGTGQENAGAPITDGSLNAKGWADITKQDLEDLADSFDYRYIDSIG